MRSLFHGIEKYQMNSLNIASMLYILVSIGNLGGDPMSKPNCPDCGKTDKVVKSDSGYHYNCQRCGDSFDRNGNKIKK